MKRLLITLVLPILMFGGETIYQISTIDALLTGYYDGFVSLETLSEKGDFGIGTYDGLEGEMVVLDGIFYQVKADGKVYRPDLSTTSPFASVIRFDREKNLKAEENLDFPTFKDKIDPILPSLNIFYGFKIEGKFKYIKTRSVPKQKKPYPPLAEIASTQPTFEYENIEGTIVGFRCPDYVKGINVPGYHLHFLSKDKKVGGHLLKFIVDSANLEIDYLHEFEMMLPKTDKFYQLNLTKDKSEELKKVEK